MRMKCPACRCIAGADAWHGEADVEQFMRIKDELPFEIGRRTINYLALFRPRSGRPLAWSTALRLVGELRDLVIDPMIQWDRQTPRPNSARAWYEAMERVIQNPPRRLPLKSHGYLRAIAWEIADEVDRAHEVADNRRERSGAAYQEAARDRDPKPALEPLLTPELMHSIREKNMGRKP